MRLDTIQIRIDLFYLFTDYKYNTYNQCTSFLAENRCIKVFLLIGQRCRRYTVGLDVDKLVFTVKILLYAGNSCINSPLVLTTLGTIYLFKRLSAGNFSFSTKATAVTKNTYTSYNYKNLLPISEHVPARHKNPFTDNDFGYFLAGLIEGDGWFGYKQLHIIFALEDTSLAYYIKKRIGYGNVYKIKDKKAVRYICKKKSWYVYYFIFNKW